MQVISNKQLSLLDYNINKKRIIVTILNVFSILNILISIIFINRINPLVSYLITIFYSLLDFIISFLFIKINSINKRIISTYKNALNNQEKSYAVFLNKSNFLTTYNRLSFYEYCFLIDGIKRCFYVYEDNKLLLNESSTYNITYYNNILVGASNDQESN